MDFFNADIGWLFIAYLSGTIVTYFLFWKQVHVDVIEKTIDSLIDNGFIRTRKTANGEVELLKWDADEEEV